MFERLKTLLRGAGSVGDQPTGLGFAESQFYFLCLPERFASGIPTDSSPEEFVEYVKEAAADLAASQAYEPFSYSEADHRVLPLFTSEDHAQEFVQTYVARVQRIIPFQVLGALGSSLVSAVRTHDKVILNPGTPDEAILRSRIKGGAVGRHGA
jgi:hypothetical protein